MLQPGRARVLRGLVHEVARFVREELPKTLTGEAIQTQREAIEVETNEKIAELTKPFEADLREAGMGMVQQGQPPAVQTHIVPLFEGKPLGGAELAQLLGEQKIMQEQIEEWEQAARRVVRIGLGSAGGIDGGCGGQHVVQT